MALTPTAPAALIDSRRAWRRWLLEGDDSLTADALRAGAAHLYTRDALVVMPQRGSWADTRRWLDVRLWAVDERTVVQASRREPDADMSGRVADGFALIAEGDFPPAERANAYAAIAYLAWLGDECALAEMVVLDALAAHPTQRLALLVREALRTGMLPAWIGYHR